MTDTNNKVALDIYKASAKQASNDVEFAITSHETTKAAIQTAIISASYQAINSNFTYLNKLVQGLKYKDNSGLNKTGQAVVEYICFALPLLFKEKKMVFAVNEKRLNDEEEVFDYQWSADILSSVNFLDYAKPKPAPKQYNFQASLDEFIKKADKKGFGLSDLINGVRVNADLTEDAFIETVDKLYAVETIIDELAE